MSRAATVSFVGLLIVLGLIGRPAAQSSRTPTQARLAASANPVSESQAVTLTAEVRSLFASQSLPGGDVVFFDANTELGSAPLTAVNGIATAVLADVRLQAGPHALIARYGGDAAFAWSDSVPPLPLRVTAR